MDLEFQVAFPETILLGLFVILVLVIIGVVQIFKIAKEVRELREKVDEIEDQQQMLSNTIRAAATKSLS